MELQITELEDLEEKVGSTPTRAGELQAGTRVQSDTFFSQSFMRNHTEFDSFAGLCEQGPREFDGIDDTRDISRDRLNGCIVATTDFETWEGMKTQAAEGGIIDQLVSWLPHDRGRVQQEVRAVADDARTQYRPDPRPDHDVNFPR